MKLKYTYLKSIIKLSKDLLITTTIAIITTKLLLLLLSRLGLYKFSF